MKLDKDQFFYMHSLRKKLRITAIFSDDETCNAWLEKNPDHGVIAVFDPYVFTANLYDKGI